MPTDVVSGIKTCEAPPALTILVFLSPMSPSNQPIGSEMSRTARDELFDDRDGWNREKHPGRAK